MVYEGINFYPTEKSEADFIDHEKHHGLSEAQLKEAYRLLTKSEKNKKAVSKTPPSLN